QVELGWIEVGLERQGLPVEEGRHGEALDAKVALGLFQLPAGRRAEVEALQLPPSILDRDAEPEGGLVANRPDLIGEAPGGELLEAVRARGGMEDLHDLVQPQRLAAVP